jgi:phosphoglycerol transferase MdoB-like AlkP superfamily enzyme
LKNKLQQMYFRLRAIVVVFLTMLLLFFLYRVAYLYHILSGADRIQYKSDIVKSFLVGIRFDTVTICYGLLLPVILILTAFFISSQKFQRFTDSFNRYFISIVMTLYALLLVIDFYYYNYFQAHFNVLVFGLWKDDTEAVMKSVYTDYPFFRVILFVIIFYFLFIRLVRYLFRKISPVGNSVYHGIISIIILGLMAIGLRGSFGTFPIQIDDANVSANDRVNLLPVNGIFALKTVLSFGLKQGELAKFDDEIKKLGYDDRSKSWKEYFGKIKITDSVEAFFTKTPVDTFLENNPPNVIFFLMESMSNNNLYLQSAKTNVTGALQKYIEGGMVYRKFLPAQNGTINTLEALMINTPITSLAQSEYGADTFPSAAAKPFFDKGYATTFITGGKINWRNLNTFVPRQYFRTVEGDGDIEEQNPQTQECEWGVYDEYLFNHVFKKLNNKQPQFIFALSTTNHTPFHLPDHYKPFPVVLNDSVKGILQVGEQRAIDNLTNFQYSNDCLGRFLDELRSSPYAENTIVFATGDHNNLMLFNFSPSQLYYKLSVPLLMYVPAKYLTHSKVDTSRWGSHKDIFPTLYNLSLSDATYFNGGNDLLSGSLAHEHYWATDVMSYIAMDDNGVVRYDSKAERYEWTNKYLLKNTNDLKTDSLLKKARRNFTAQYFFIKDVTKK